MLPPERKDIWFDSADGHSQVAGYIYALPAVPPVCVLQISHGMCEYIGRYADFAAYLAANGVVVCGNDHLGHGGTAAQAEDLGFFTQKGGHRYALEDLHSMNALVRKAYPGLPVAMLGHSMGSFFARQYAATWPQTIDALLISGTGGPNPGAGFGIVLTRLLAALRGPRHRSKLVYYMVFGNYLRKIPQPASMYDWISRDEEIVRQYAADPLCTFPFTVNGFHELFCILRAVSSPKWAAKLPKQLPVFLFSGDDDPVGNYGKGVATVHGWLQQAGISHLRHKLYPGGRHEMLNETNRDEVYADVLAFLREALPDAFAAAPQ